MTAEWGLYYAMVAAHVLGGGFALFWGRSVHRLVLLNLVAGVILQLVGCGVLTALHVPIASISVNLDLGLNILMAFGLLALILSFPAANWIAAMMCLQACNIGLDGFLFDQTWADMRHGFAEAANALNIMEISILAWAVMRARWPRKADPVPAFYRLPPA